MVAESPTHKANINSLCVMEAIKLDKYTSEDPQDCQIEVDPKVVKWLLQFAQSDAYIRAVAELNVDPKINKRMYKIAVYALAMAISDLLIHKKIYDRIWRWNGDRGLEDLKKGLLYNSQRSPTIYDDLMVAIRDWLKTEPPTTMTEEDNLREFEKVLSNLMSAK